MMGRDFDPEEFGKVLARLDNQDRILTRLEDSVSNLVIMANQGKGGLMMLMSVGSIVGAVVGWVVEHLITR